MVGFWSLKLDPECRAELLKIIPPRYPIVVANHITMGTDEPGNVPSEIAALGWADDGIGIEAIILSINGMRDRPDSNPYHITWSYDSSKMAPEILDLNPIGKQKARTYRPMHSNKLISLGRWSCPLARRFEIKVLPTA